MITIRTSKFDDLNEMQKLFADTVETVCKNEYTPDQIRVWKSSIENTTRWTNKLSTQHVLIAMLNNLIVGYISLEGDNYVDLLYIHKDYQRQGIADRLYQEIELEAKKRGVTELISDVSITALPFFEKKGFTILKENIITIKGVELINYKMSKSL